MNKQEYVNKLVDIFSDDIELHSEDFKDYCYNNHIANKWIKNFFNDIEELDLSVSDCYNAHGIGNNNEYTIYKKEIDEEGFIIEKKIAKIYYCYGIYGGMCFWLKDAASGNNIVGFSYL